MKLTAKQIPYNDRTTIYVNAKKYGIETHKNPQMKMYEVSLDEVDAILEKIKQNADATMNMSSRNALENFKHFLRNHPILNKGYL